MEKKQIIRYSEAFKLQVVDQIERGEFSGVTQAARSYGIKGCETVTRWVRKYGNEKLLPKQIKIMKQQEINETQQLRKRVQELERALSDSHMRGLLNEYNLDRNFRKKPDPRRHCRGDRHIQQPPSSQLTWDACPIRGA